ncbi:MAG: Gfo/Idh/MocA family oxidoreductase [Elusimicrobiales bacterium]
MKTYRGAIVGFGAVVEKGHVPAFAHKSARFEIVAVADQSPARLEAAKTHYPSAKFYGNLKKLLKAERGLDFAVVGTPPLYHAKLSAQCLKAGLNVLCEKPLVFKFREAKKLAELAKRQDRCLFTVHNWKNAPPIAKALELVKSGAIGEVHHVELHVLRSKAAATAGGDNWRENPALSGGGIMMDHGWHNFYLARAFAGQEPLSIKAALRRPAENCAEDCASCLIDFGGATALVYLTWRSPIRKNLIIVYGSKGNIAVQDSDVILETPSGSQTFATGDKLSGGSAHPVWMAGLLDDFAAELDTPALRGENMKEALACAALAEQGYKSAGTCAAKRIALTA